MGRILPGHGSAGADLLSVVRGLRGCHPQSRCSGRRFRYPCLHHRRDSGSIPRAHPCRDGRRSLQTLAEGLPDAAKRVWEQVVLQEPDCAGGLKKNVFWRISIFVGDVCGLCDGAGAGWRPISDEQGKDYCCPEK